VTVTVTVPSNGILETVGIVAFPDGKIGLGAAEPVKIGPAGADGVKCSDELTEEDDDG